MHMRERGREFVPDARGVNRGALGKLHDRNERSEIAANEAIVMATQKAITSRLCRRVQRASAGMACLPFDEGHRMCPMTEGGDERCEAPSGMTLVRPSTLGNFRCRF